MNRISEKRRRTIAFSTPLVLAIVVAAGLALSAHYVHGQTVSIYEQRARIVANVEQFRFFDAARTDSARLYAATAGQRHLRRYNELAPRLFALLKQTVELVDTPEAADGVTRMDATSRALVALEQRAFDLARRGKTAEASALLDGFDYARAKRLYESSAEDANRLFMAASAAESRRVDHHQLVAQLLAGLGGLVLLIAAGFQLRLERNHRRVAAENDRARQTESERAAAEAARIAAENDHHEKQREFTEILQITRSEEEAYELLKRHLERSLAGSEVVVLNRNNSRDRLEPMTAVAEGSQLLDGLKDAEPDSCLAVRLGRAHERSELEEPLLTCELCETPGSTSTCMPALVGGEVIGSVLVQFPEPLGVMGRRTLEDSVTQASPVLANLRNLALSQTRSLTDGLTGLPNRRAIDDTLKRMVAQAARTSRPLSAVLFDLDHFKQINDVFGHEKGDEVLAAIGAATAGFLRASDFAGRYGGEEFVLLLPDTDRDGAVTVAEKLRRHIATVEVTGVTRAITASLGVAALPADGGEPGLLLRAADRALYRAKTDGRNRVAAFEPAEPEALAAPVA